MIASKADESWRYSPDHGEFCRVIEIQTLWGETVCRVWLSNDESFMLQAANILA